MNFRSTILAFGLLLGMLWLFGLMLALHTGTLEKDLLLPTLHVSDADIAEVTIANRELGETDSVVFTKVKDKWRVRVPPVKRSAPVSSSEIEGMIRDLHDARQNREVSVRNDPAYYGLDKPSVTVTLRGKAKDDEKEKEWKVFVGKKSPDNAGFVYVNSSERPGEVLAVPESSLRKVFFKNAQDLREHDLLETSETSLQWVRLSEGKNAVELKKHDTDWRFVEPKLGYAEWQSPEAKKLGPVELAPDGLRAVASALSSMRVQNKDDFVPVTDDDLGRYGLASGSERLRIDISNDAAEKNKQTLLVGNKGKDDRYYARMANEESIVLVDGVKLKPLFAALKDPQSLRSKQIVHVDAKNIARVDIQAGKETIELRQPEAGSWKIALGSETRQASEPAVKELIDALKAERQIKEFIDAGADAKKKDAELGLDQPSATVKLSIEKREKEEDEKDPKDKKGPPSKVTKSTIVVDFGAAKDDVVYGKSEADGVVTRFSVAKSLLEKIVPKTGALAFLDVGMPVFASDKATAITRVVDGQKIEIVKDKDRWQLVNAKGSGKNFADSKRVAELLRVVNHLQAASWVQKVDAKSDLGEFGLKPPYLEVSVRVHDKELKPADYASIAGLAVTALARPAAASLAAQLTAAGVDEISYKFGKKTDKDGKEEIYGIRAGIDLVFRVAAPEVQSLASLDVRDRFWLTHFEPVVDASLAGLILTRGPNLLLASSPLATHQIARFDPTAVKEVRVAIRTPAELRRFSFIRKDDKTWQDKSGLEEFDVDAPQVNQLVEKMSQLTAERFVSLQGGVLPDQKLTTKEATVNLELLRADGKAEFTLLAGAKAEGNGYYAQTSAWPNAVIVVPAAEIDALQRGAGYFGKTKVAAQ